MRKHKKRVKKKRLETWFYRNKDKKEKGETNILCPKRCKNKYFTVAETCSFFKRKWQILKMARTAKIPKSSPEAKEMKKWKEQKNRNKFHQGKQKGNRKEDKSEARRWHEHRGADDRQQGKSRGVGRTPEEKEGRVAKDTQMVADSLQKVKTWFFPIMIFAESCPKEKR